MIKLENVSKYYVGNNEVALGLRKLNLEFETGELVAITGESGSGKSTLLNVLSGSDTYEEGEMYIEGRPTSYYDEQDWENYRKDYIGFIYQSYNLIDSYSVYENVHVALAVKGGTENDRGKVYGYLEKVGLRHLAHRKATHLSSGQKQRLAIARALAKETPIIVADEPTGNLDSENSAEVMALLNEVATDRLVFVVTHNYDEIEQYATRKIRMKDGEVSEDISLREKKLSGRTGSEIKTAKAGEEISKSDAARRERQTAHGIVKMNRKNKPVTFAFLAAFMTVVAASFYILLGSFFSNLDNTTSKVFETTYFKNDDITRIIVRNEGGSALTEADAEKLSSLTRVDSVDLYDSVNDMYYVYEENVDYEYVYNYKDSAYDEPSYRTVKALRKDRFMRTASAISAKDLKAGSLPEGLYEAVICSDDESLIGKTITVYVGNENLWGTQMAELNVTVTGILKKETSQIYFSEKLGQMFSVFADRYAEKIVENGGVDEESGLSTDSADYELLINALIGFNDDGPTLLMTDTDAINRSGEDEEWLYNKTLETAYEIGKVYVPIFIINEKLTGSEVIVSAEYVDRNCVYDDSGVAHPRDIYNLLRLEITDSTTDGVYENIYMVAQSETSGSTQAVIEVSSELYEKLFGQSEGSSQIAVYIDDYAYMDSVLNKITGLGYQAASVYRTAAGDYDEELVARKAVDMGISLGAFVLVFFVGVFIIGTIMSISNKDFKILRLLGLSRSCTDMVNGMDIMGNMLLSVFIALILIAVLNFAGVPYVRDIVKYYRIVHYLVYAAALAAFTKLLLVRTKVRMRKNG